MNETSLAYHKSIYHESFRCSTSEMDEPEVSSADPEGFSPSSSCCVDEATQLEFTPADSGYASKDGSLTNKTSRKPNWTSVLRRQSKIPHIQSFDSIAVSPSIYQRFNDLRELFNDPLCEHLASTCKKVGPLSLRLKVLGESKETAKPYVVVQCDRKISRKVRQFFAQSHVKAQYQPSQNAIGSPDLEVVVRPWAPALQALEVSHNVYSLDDSNNELQPWHLDSTWTGRGLLIKVNIGETSKFSTLSALLVIEGIGERDNENISLKKIHDVPKIYGLTVGHILALPQDQEEPQSMDSDSESDQYSDLDRFEDAASTNESFLSDLDFAEDSLHLVELRNNEYANPQFEPPLSESISQSAWVGIGHATHISTNSLRGMFLDWALIEITSAAYLVPQGLRPHSDRIIGEWSNGSKNLTEIMEQGYGKDVLIGSSWGVRKGSLAKTPSYILLNSSQRFTPAYTVDFSDNKG